VSHGLLDRQRVEIKEGLNGDGDLLKIFKDYMQYTLDYLLVSDGVMKHMKLAHDGVQAQ
jgi:hypothetical protein